MSKTPDYSSLFPVSAYAMVRLDVDHGKPLLQHGDYGQEADIELFETIEQMDDWAEDNHIPPDAYCPVKVKVVFDE